MPSAEMLPSAFLHVKSVKKVFWEDFRLVYISNLVIFQELVLRKSGLGWLNVTIDHLYLIMENLRSKVFLKVSSGESIMF